MLTINTFNIYNVQYVGSRSSHLERVNTYRCNIYRGWTVFTSLQKNGITEASFCYAQLADILDSCNRLEAQWITYIRCQQHL